MKSPSVVLNVSIKNMVGQLCSITITPARYATRHPQLHHHHVTRTTAPPPLYRLISSVHNTVSLPPCLFFIVLIIKLKVWLSVCTWLLNLGWTFKLRIDWIGWWMGFFFFFFISKLCWISARINNFLFLLLETIMKGKWVFVSYLASMFGCRKKFYLNLFPLLGYEDAEAQNC